MSKRRKILIVGGVAGGANVAARLRRLDEDAEIIVFERGPYVSFANCGLPYHIGGEIRDRSKLLVHTPESLGSRFNLEVRVHHEVTAIDRNSSSIRYRSIHGTEKDEHYDVLVLATGAAPVKPPIAGIAREGVFLLRDIPDMDRILEWLKARTPKRAVVIGGGFIGLEMAEQLRRRGLELTLIEASDQILSPLDPELVTEVQQELTTNGVELVLGDGVEAFESGTSSLIDVVTRGGKRLAADLVLLGIGVRPESKLAREAGLQIGSTGGIVVDRFLRTSDPNIYAVGDCIEFPHPLTGLPTITALAGPANRQGRIAANNIAGLSNEYHGSLGTAIVRVFGLSVGVTGLNEKTLRALGLPYQTVRLHPASHASYYPGATRISLKLIYDPSNGRILGAQAVGKDGVDKRIDVIAAAVHGKMSVDDLAELELSYAPPFGAAKDPINLAGMIGENIFGGLSRFVDDPDDLPGAFILDVRKQEEYSRGAVPGAINIPLDELRERIAELPTDRPIVVYCQSGSRSHNAARILRQIDRDAYNLSGGYITWTFRDRSVLAKSKNS